MSPVAPPDPDAEVLASTRMEVRRQGLLSAARRLSVLMVASLPALLVVDVLLWSSVPVVRLQAWTIFGALLAIISLSLTGLRWGRLPLQPAEELRRSLVLLFGLPIALQWGGISFVIGPTDDHGAIVVTMSILVAATAVVAAVGAASLGVSLPVLAAVVVPNLVWFAIEYGLGSVPALLLGYGSLLTLAVGLLAQRELAQREVLIARFDELLRSVTRDRSHLSELNAELQYRATHDLLMGIPNRELLQAELEQALEAAEQDEGSGRVGLLFLDLDRFKFVNDTLGHQAGDALLVMVGARIEAALADENALVARVGGDELVVLMRRVESQDHLRAVADKLLGKFVDPFTIDGVELRAATSLGMAESVAGESADDLYRHADAALYVAKQQGRARAVYADDSLRNERNSRVKAELELRAALRCQEIEAWFQPEVDLMSGEIVAGEALARWRMGEEIAHAGTFIDVAQRAGLLEALMFDMLEQVATWRRRTGSDLSIGVNIATNDLPALLNAHADDPRRSLRNVRLEIAEPDVLGDLAGTKVLLQEIRSLGAEIILDDFGSGFSSLRMLSDLPIDGIKIDREYMARVENDVRVRRLVTSLAEFGRSCGIKVIAEGVETPSQAEFLMEIGIDRAQGRLYSPAVEPDVFDCLVGTGCLPTEPAARL